MSDLYYRIRYRKLANVTYQPFTREQFNGKEFIARVIAVHSPNLFTATFENLGGIDIKKMKLADYSAPADIEAKNGLEDKILNTFVKVKCLRLITEEPVEIICYRKGENINNYMKKNFPFRDSRVSDLVSKFNSMRPLGRPTSL